MQKLVLSLVMVLGALSLATVTLLAPATAGAEEFSKAVGEPLIAAQAAMKKKQWDLAMVKVKEAAAVPNKKPHEEFQVNELMAYLANRQGDYATAAKLHEANLNSGRLAADQMPARLKVLALAYAQPRNTNYAKTIDYGNRYLKMRPGDVEVTALVAQAQYQTGDCKNAIRSSQAAIAAARRAGQSPKENWLNLKLNCQHKLKDEEGMIATREQLVRYFPRKENWDPLLVSLSSKPETDERAKLNFYRLMLELDLLKDPEQYVEMAEIAIEKEPGEAVKIMEKGFANKLLDGKGKERHMRLLTHAKTRAESTQGALPALDQQARKDPKGVADIELGRAYLGSGQYEKAVEALQRGLKKGGVRNVDEVQMMLGRAYLKLNQKEQARRAFNAVPDDSKLAQVASLWGVYATQS